MITESGILKFLEGLPNLDGINLCERDNITEEFFLECSNKEWFTIDCY